MLDGRTKRRSVLAMIGVAATEMLTHGVSKATAQCTTGNCSGNQVCCDGFTCTPTGNGNSKTCKPDNAECSDCEDCRECPTPEPGSWHCVEQADCGGDLVCNAGVCCSIVTVNVGDQITNIAVPITIINTCSGKRRKHQKHRKH